MSFIGKYKWYIVGGASLVGLGVLAAYLVKLFSISNPKKILFVGDSISAGNTTYPAKVKEQRSDLDIDIAAVGGKTTSWMLDALKEKLASKKYDRVYIYGGLNDAFNNVPINKIYDNLQQMIDLVSKQGGHTFIIRGYVANGSYLDWQKMKPTKYVTTKEGYIPLIENYKNFRDGLSSNIKNAHFIKEVDLGDTTSDGTHPNGTGQKILTETILKTL
jgi:lysophospholipase L1-like esterase